MTEAAIYTRVSSREQQQEGFSLFAQSRLLTEYAERNSFCIIQAFEDVETAKATGRKQFLRMVDFFRRNHACRVLLVEKTDRISRNFHDAVTLEDLEIAIHFVKEGQVISKESQSQATLIYGFNLVMARHYSNNLREEVKKGMREKAAKGVFPGYAPFGYRNNRAERTIEADPEDGPTAVRIFELYATGNYSLSTLSKVLQVETGRSISRSNLYWILNNPFYNGVFDWGGQRYRGTHPILIKPGLHQKAQTVLEAHGRAPYFKREIAFRGLMRCAYDGGVLTGDVQRERYIYYRCTASRGPCPLPRFREAELAERLGETLRALETPAAYTGQIISALESPEARLESRLADVRRRMDSAYTDKIDGKIPEAYWERRFRQWQAEERELEAALHRVKQQRRSEWAREAAKVLRLANGACSRYRSKQQAHERAQVLRVFLSGCVVGERLMPQFRQPFDLIARKADAQGWELYFQGAKGPSEEER